jgi:hypothetical protein
MFRKNIVLAWTVPAMSPNNARPLEDTSIEMQVFLNADERRHGETVLEVFSYSPKSTIIITNQRIIGKSGETNPTIFQGTIEYQDIQDIQYVSGIPLIGIPQMVVKHQSLDGEEKITVFKFPGHIFSHVIYWISGYNPKRIYERVKFYIDLVR